MRFTPYSVLASEQFTPFNIEFVVVGGGAAGLDIPGGTGGGGGGVWTGSLEINAHYGFDCIVGTGGTLASPNGTSSSFGTLATVGGGVGTNGGSGGQGFTAGISGTTSSCVPDTTIIGAGGGGANGNGESPDCGDGGDGTFGVLLPRWNGVQLFGGGGGGGVTTGFPGNNYTTPYQPSGGRGGSPLTGVATNGNTNQGGGGGGKGNTGSAGNGGDGIIWVRYLSEGPLAQGGFQVQGGGGYYYHEFTGSGVLQF
jgi:hypothetical protein